MSAVPHPIPYQGSKRTLAQAILRRLPARMDRLVEPFAGSAALSLAAAQSGAADQFWINDAHRPLADLWVEILQRPERLASQYAKRWRDQLGQERTFYNEVRNAFNRTHQPADFLYLLARSVKACVRYNAQGEFNNSPDNRRRGAKPDNMRRRIEDAASLLSERCTITCRDYTEVLAECGPDDLIYMDPPYQGVGGSRDHRYAPRVEHEAFCDALAELNARECRFAVSYDGRTGDKSHGRPLPKSLRLRHIELPAGRSSQATLLGRDDQTVQSLYLSRGLTAKPEKRGSPRKRAVRTTTPNT